MNLSYRLALAGGVLALTPAAFAQVGYHVVGSSYTQPFAIAEAANGATLAWQDNVTYTGWYADRFRLGTSNDVTTATYGSGGSSDGGLFLYRKDSLSNEGSIGLLPQDSVGSLALGLRLTNTTGQVLTQFSLAYDGEQWRRAGNVNAMDLKVSYQFGNPANLYAGTWTAIDDLTFTSPIVGAAAAESLNGNAAANRFNFDPVTATSLAWAPGTDLWIRFDHPNYSGTDHALAVDNVVFSATSAIPEPSTYAGLAGAVVLGVACWRRRQLHKAARG